MKDEIKGAIERVAQFADERSRAIRVQFTAGEVKVFSSALETGESEESVPASIRARISRSVLTRNTCWIFCGRSRRSRFRSTERSEERRRAAAAGEATEQDEQYRYVVMPMRI